MGKKEGRLLAGKRGRPHSRSAPARAARLASYDMCQKQPEQIEKGTIHCTHRCLQLSPAWQGLFLRSETRSRVVWSDFTNGGLVTFRNQLQKCNQIHLHCTANKSTARKAPQRRSPRLQEKGSNTAGTQRGCHTASNATAGTIRGGGKIGLTHET